MQIKIEQLYCSDKFYGGVDDALRAASQEQKANLLRKQATFRGSTTDLPAKWRQRNDRRNSILITWLWRTSWEIINSYWTRLSKISWSGQLFVEAEGSGKYLMCETLTNHDILTIVPRARMGSESIAHSITLFSFLRLFLLEKWQIASVSEDIH